MRLAFVTDNHFDSNSRFEETVRIHGWIAEDAARRGCTGTILGGDLFEGKSDPEERNAAGEWLLRMAELGPVVGVKGNHEIDADLDIFCRLSGRHPIRFHDRPSLDRIGEVAIACVPWPRKAHLLALLGPASVQESSAAAQQCLRQIFLGLAEELDALPECGRLALAHVMIDGARTDHDQPIVGADMNVSLSDLALLRADFYACGHVHAFQGFRIGDAPGIYGGSPRHNNWGEPTEKSYAILEFDGPRLVGWERVPTPATPMVLLEAVWEGPDRAFCRNIPVGDFERGAEIRLRYRVESDAREPARAAALKVAEVLRERGAVDVKVEEEVIPKTRARTPEVAAARTLPDQLAAFWASRGEDLSPARRERLLVKLGQLEEEARAAS